MRKLAIAFAVAVFGFAGSANAQHVIGTGGTPGASLGYYSPYPGAMYSPFRQAPALPVSNFSTYNARFGGYPQIYNNGSTITRFPGSMNGMPHYGSGGFNNYHGMRRW